jgi:hypothetical protein
MALEHVSLPIFGVQFHPEAVLSEGGFQLLANFLHLAKIPCHDPHALARGELATPNAVLPPLPSQPVTF